MVLDEATHTDVEARIDTLESRFEIDRLVSNYCHGVDKHDLDTFLSIWHPDAAWKIGEPYGDFQGTDGIRKAVDLVWEALPETHHWTTNLVVDFQDADRATGVCDVTADCVDAGGRTVIIAATYWDTYERREGTWAIAKRKVDIYWFKALELQPESAVPDIETA